MDSTSEIPEIPAPEEENILDDVHYTLYQANAGRRLANYLVDWIGFYLVWRLILIQVVVQFIFWINFPVENRTLLLLFSYFLSTVSFGLVVGGVEAATGGKTLGKLITGTRAVNEDGSRISAKKALLRYLVRLVPFEPFSALGSPSYPWHDRWTKTVVIDEKLTTLPPGV